MSGTNHLFERYLEDTMSISVLLFASYADSFGARSIDVPVAVPCTVDTLVETMRTLPGGGRLPNAPLVAVNREWARADRMITVGDEVAVIPPVAGG
jgi:molybdopterin converting factor small subunit